MRALLGPISLPRIHCMTRPTKRKWPGNAVCEAGGSRVIPRSNQTPSVYAGRVPITTRFCHAGSGFDFLTLRGMRSPSCRKVKKSKPDPIRMQVRGALGAWGPYRGLHVDRHEEGAMGGALRWTG